MKTTLKRGIGPTLLAAATVALSAAGWAQGTLQDQPPASTQDDPATINREMNPKAQTNPPTMKKEMSAKDPAAKASLSTFLKADPNLQKRLDEAVGYAILPSVAKGAVGIGGASGKGVLIENGRETGKVTLSQVTVGLQLGGQTYSELILFENQNTLDSFKRGQFATSAQMSAVAASAGASANARYVHGVQIYTIAKGGLMYEASVGGQKFTFTPYAPESVG